MPGLDERARNHRPSDRRARPLRRSREQDVDVDTGTPSVASRAAISRTRSTRLRALLREKLRQRAIRGIEEVAEDVDVAAFVHGRDLDAVDELDADDSAAMRRASARPGDRVVVGHAHRRDAGRGDALDELGRRQAAVRRGGVEVEIDHGGRRQIQS